MIKIRIIALGSPKEKYLKEAVNEYEKRLSCLCSLETIELTPVRLSDNPGKGEIEVALDKEADMILTKITNGSCVFALCVEGEMLSSKDLSDRLEKISSCGCGSFTFVIGSSYGLGMRIKKAARFSLSFSAMTFPHQLFRIMLLEQIYRCFKISGGGKYHK